MAIKVKDFQDNKIYLSQYGLNDIKNGNRMANILSIAPIHKPFTE